MPAIALRCPTVSPSSPNLLGGHAFIVLPRRPRVTTRDLLAEKVRAELRKWRAGSKATSTLNLLCGDWIADEADAIAAAAIRWGNGQIHIQLNGMYLQHLDAPLAQQLRRDDTVSFVVPAP